MKKEEIVCSLEQARRLKQLGVTGLPVFAHTSDDDQDYLLCALFGYDWHWWGDSSKFIYPAWTFSELALVMRDKKLRIYHINKIYKVKVFDSEVSAGKGNTLATAMADLLLSMIEADFIRVPDVNAVLEKSEE